VSYWFFDCFIGMRETEKISFVKINRNQLEAKGDDLFVGDNMTQHSMVILVPYYNAFPSKTGSLDLKLLIVRNPIVIMCFLSVFTFVSCLMCSIMYISIKVYGPKGQRSQW